MILTLAQVAEIVPAIKTLSPVVVSPDSMAKLYDTLLNSAVVPPAPWPQVPHKFDHILNLPTDNGRHVTYFVFYPL